jgi:hypothetical protein
MLFVTHLWLGLYRQPEEWPWLYVFLIFVQGFFIVINAGKSLGLDAVITRKPFGWFAYVSAQNHSWDTSAYLAGLPPAAIGEIHLAGHAVRQFADGRILRIDDHGSAVIPQVWALYQEAPQQLLRLANMRHSMSTGRSRRISSCRYCRCSDEPVLGRPPAWCCVEPLCRTDTGSGIPLGAVDD